MSYVWQRWMAREFRAAGLTVVEVEGWKNRGRPASTGNFDPGEGITNHHTGTTTSTSSTHPTLATLIQGRSDLPGPLCHWSVAHDGTVYVIAAGRANHAGRVDKRLPGASPGMDGNAVFMGDEIDTNGTQHLADAQRHAAAVTNAVYLKHTGRPLDRVHRHADLTSRKWDIGSITTAQLRADARSAPTEGDDMPFTENELRKIIREEVGAVLDEPMNAHPKGDARFKDLSLRGLLKAVAVAVGVRDAGSKRA